MNVTAAAAAERAEPGAAREALEQIERTSHEAIGELRGILGVLRDPEASEPPRAPTPGIDDVADLVGRARAGGFDVRVQVDGVPPPRISDATSIAAYRIVQESLTNVRRHAPGAHAVVTLRFEPHQLALRVDNGPGNGTALAIRQSGVGILGMRERAGAVGGQLSAGLREGGFRVLAELPYGLTR
jgi:signal transduction histidine kinase